MFLRVLANALRLGQPTLSTDGTFPSRIPRGTKPSGVSIHDLVNSGNEAPQFAMVRWYGTGSNNDTFACRLIGWSHAKGDGNAGQTDLWVPTTLGEFTLTLSNVVGVANSILGATNRFADTLAIVKEPTLAADVTPAGSILTYSPADDGQIAWAKVPLHGCEMIEPIFDLGAGTGADCLIGLS